MMSLEFQMPQLQIFSSGWLKKSKSPDDLVNKIESTETLTIDSKVRSFANSLFEKVPKTSGKEISQGQKRKNDNREKERMAQELQLKNQSYGLVLSDEEDSAPVIQPKKKKKEKKKRKKSQSSEEDEFEKIERERAKDISERDDFHKRMIEKDREKQRNIVSKSDKRAYEEAKKRLEQEAMDQEKIIPELRKKSRYRYLEERKAKKVDELKDDIMDDEFLFNEEELTAKEKKEREYKKTVLKLAKQYDAAGEIEKVQRYRMPTDKKGNENDRYVEVDEKEKAPNYEQRKWEEEHLHSAQLKFGAKDAKERHAAKAPKQYELLLDDEIEFIQALKLPGSKKKKKKKKNDDETSSEEEEVEVSEHEKKKMTFKEVKESLPVFPFRDSLLAAIEEHQILIVEGET